MTGLVMLIHTRGRVRPWKPVFARLLAVAPELLPVLVEENFAKGAGTMKLSCSVKFTVQMVGCWLERRRARSALKVLPLPDPMVALSVADEREALRLS